MHSKWAVRSLLLGANFRGQSLHKAFPHSSYKQSMPTGGGTPISVHTLSDPFLPFWFPSNPSFPLFALFRPFLA